MKSVLLKFAFLFIATSCICGMCSKGDESGSDDSNSNNPNNPVLKPEDTWAYFEDCPGLVYFYPDNNRPMRQQWIATKTGVGFAGINTVTQKRFLAWSFENTGNTRFLSNDLNPSGNESLSIFINEISQTPGTGSYTLDIDFKQGFCWYYVKTSSGTLHDSTRVQGLASSTFNITKMDFVREVAANADRYKMSGNATFNIMYWQSGTGSTSDIHTLQCKFNNVFIDFMK